MKLYNPADPSSSPYDPAMGDIVLYRTQRHGHQAPEQFPAIVVRAYPDDRCDLTVFTTYGMQHIMRVRFSSEDQSENTWGWLPQKHERRATTTENTVAGSVAQMRDVHAGGVPTGSASLPRGAESPVDSNV